MASATPGGAPGYDYDKEFGNNVAHSTARTSQRLRGYTARSPEVKGRTPLARFWQCNCVPGFRRVGFLCVQACGEAACRPCEQTFGSPETKRRWPNHTEPPRPRWEDSIPG